VDLSILKGNVKRRPVGHGNEKGRNTLNVARASTLHGNLSRSHRWRFLPTDIMAVRCRQSHNQRSRRIHALKGRHWTRNAISKCRRFTGCCVRQRLNPGSFTAVLWKSKGRARRRFQLANRTGHLDHPFAAQFTVRFWATTQQPISNLCWGWGRATERFIPTSSDPIG